MFRNGIWGKLPPLVYQHAKWFYLAIPILSIRMLSNQVYYSITSEKQSRKKMQKVVK